MVVDNFVRGLAAHDPLVVTGQAIGKLVEARITVGPLPVEALLTFGTAAHLRLNGEIDHDDTGYAVNYVHW